MKVDESAQEAIRAHQNDKEKEEHAKVGKSSLESMRTQEN